MSNRLDQLFKNKLADHALAPSDRAWEQVSARLAKKNSRPWALRMAAALLLVGALTATLFWLSSRHQDLPVLTKNDSSKPKAVKPTPATVSPTQVVDKPAPTSGQAVARKKKQIPPVKETTREKAEYKTEELPHEASLPSIIINQEEPVQEVAAAEVPPERPIVLEYRLETIAPPHTAETATQSEPKEKSGLLKVIDFARDAKNGDSGLGDLRQAKDELFALNFKKDKQNNHK